MSAYHFKIVTPKGTAFESDVVHVEVPGERGYLGVLAHHAAFVTSSPGGRLTVRNTQGETKPFKVGQGFFEVSKNQAVLLAQSCEALS